MYFLALVGAFDICGVCMVGNISETSMVFPFMYCTAVTHAAEQEEFSVFIGICCDIDPGHK